MKKTIILIVSVVLVLSTCLPFASALTTEGMPNETGLSSLSDMKVGDTIYVGETAITKGSDDDIGPSTPTSRAVVEGFTVNFGGSTSVDKTLTLNSTYRYFYIKIVNTGNNTISMTIGNDSTTQSNNFHQFPKGTYYVWSTNQWPASSQGVSFSSNNGMYGNAYAYLCSTLAEAEAHN